jgi:hypothetical protein
MVQTVSRWLPTAADRVRAQVKSCGICGGESGTEAGFLRVLRFPLTIFIPPTVLHIQHHLSSGVGRIGELVADVPSGLTLTPPEENKKIKKIILLGGGLEVILYIVY